MRLRYYGLFLVVLIVCLQLLKIQQRDTIAETPPATRSPKMDAMFMMMARDLVSIIFKKGHYVWPFCFL